MASSKRILASYVLWIMLATISKGASSTNPAGTHTFDSGDSIVPETCGQNFIFAFPASHPSVTHDAYVMVTTYSVSSVSVTVSVPGIQFSNTSMVSISNYANITFPRTVMFNRDEILANKTVIVTADDDVCVYGICTSGSTADGFNVLPKRALGQRYILTSYQPLINYRHPSEFIITALDEETSVNITFNHDGHEDEPTLQKVLQPYESFQYRDYAHDLTGTLISSNKPFSVMSGNECSNVPNAIGKCEYLITHMPGTEGFGRHFVLAPFLGRTSGYIFRVLAINNATNVTISDGTSVQLSQFTFFEGDVTSSKAITTITTNKDVIVTQYAKGLYSDYKTGDPFMLLVPPTNFFPNNVTFPVTTIPSTASQQAYINVIVRCEENLDIVVNGRTDVLWQDRHDAGEFCVLQREMDTGLHSVGHPSRDASFVVVVYGFVWRASFAYFAGYNLKETVNNNPGVTQAPTAQSLTLPTGSITYPDSAGRHFVFAFPTPTSSMTGVYLLVTTLTVDTTSISISIPGIQFQKSVMVSRSQYANVSLPYNSIIQMTSSGKSQKTVIIMAQTPVSVYAVCGGRTTVDAFTVLPITTHGNEYVVASYHPLISYGHASEFTVSSLSKQTRINITTTHSVYEQYVLQPYETFQYRDVNRDLTGTRLDSDNPVSVMSGCQCANVPATVGKCEYMVDHLPSVGNLGKKFVLAPFLGRRSGYVFRVMTAKDGTLVSLSDGSSFLIAPYDYHEQDVTNDEVIIVTSVHPVMVSQFSKGCYSDYLTGDPFMMLIPPVEYYSGSITFPVTTIATPETQRAYINIMIDCELTESIILDGQILTDWNKMTASQGFCVLRRRVETGVHTVWNQNPDARFAVMVYAFAWRAAYGYMAGYNIQQPTIPGTVTVPGRKTNTLPPRKTNTLPPRKTNTLLPRKTQTSKQGNGITESVKFTPPPRQPLESDSTAGMGQPTLESGDQRGNFAKSMSDQTGGMRVRQNFMMFLCILSVLLIMLVLFVLILFWRDWRRLNHGPESQQDHTEDSKSTDGIALSDMEPEPFTEYDKNPLL